VLSGQSRKLVSVDLTGLRVDTQIALRAPADDFDIASRLDRAVVIHGSEGAVSWVDLAQKTASSPQKLAPRLGGVLFLSNAESIIAANLADRVLTAVRADNRQIIAHLPLAVRPDHLCFNRDGGQLFVTGEGRHAVVVVYPYFVPQVAETMLAGHAPGAMATTDNYLFVTNPAAGDVTIVNITRGTRRKVISVASVGAEPSYITFTTDDKYALVLNRKSGDMAVISSRAIITDRATRRKSAALFTMIPVGSKPVSAAVKAVG
jgi:DNA-binding beta-propeller fold protein YncE